MSGSAPNEDGLRALGRHVDESRGRGRRRPPSSRRRRRIKRTLLVLGIVLVLVVGGGVGYGLYLTHKVHRVAVKGLAPGPTAGTDAGTTNILLVGSTTRCGLQKQTPAFGLCTKTVNGVNSDVIMILHLDPSTKTVRLLSIPRDLFIPNSRDTGTGYGAYKIANALYQGPSQLVAAIEEDFGIPIQHYVELNFDTFAKVVTALGGVTLEFPEPVHDAYSGLNVLVPGCHHLDGFEALQVVRARHLQYKSSTVTATTPATWPYETQSDLARIRRDHEFLRVLATKVADRGLSNPASDFSLINSLAPDLTVDSGMSVTYMATLALTFHGISFNNAPQWTLPVLVGTFGTYQYRGFAKGAVEFPTEPDDQATVNEFLGIDNATDSFTGKPLPSPGSVTVSVLNGTGVATQATDTSQALGGLGFQMVGVGTSTPVGTEAETLVTYDQRTPAAEAAAQLVARSLSGSVIMAYGKTTDGADVTVTTGTSFSVNSSAPTAAATKSTKKASSPTTTPSPITAPVTPTAGLTSSGTGSANGTGSAATGTSGFAPPTKAANPLKPYDPRACPAGQTGTTSGWGS